MCVCVCVYLCVCVCVCVCVVCVCVRRMHYEMEWPLGTLLFTPDVMAKYNELFSFLLRVKRAKTALQQV